MNATDVIAYAYEGALRCPECAVEAGWTDGGSGEGDREGVSPVFADSETDSPSHCEACGEYIPEALTSEGARYAVARMRAYLRTHGDEGDWDALYAWACELSSYGGAVGRIARRFRERGEFYRGTHAMRRSYSYTGGGYAYRYDPEVEALCERISNECGEGESLCAECGALIYNAAPSDAEEEWRHAQGQLPIGAPHTPYPPDPADRWETVIAPEGAYRPTHAGEPIDGSMCVVFEREGTGETYAITEASARRPAGDAAGA